MLTSIQNHIEYIKNIIVSNYNIYLLFPPPRGPLGEKRSTSTPETSPTTPQHHPPGENARGRAILYQLDTLVHLRFSSRLQFLHFAKFSRFSKHPTM